MRKTPGNLTQLKAQADILSVAMAEAMKLDRFKAMTEMGFVLELLEAAHRNLSEVEDDRWMYDEELTTVHVDIAAAYGALAKACARSIAVRIEFADPPRLD